MQDIEANQRAPAVSFVTTSDMALKLQLDKKKMEELEKENNVPGNIRFLCVDARKLGEIFAAEEIDRIYLNFSDPWPKDRHAKRRLPSKEFLALYDKFLKKDGQLEFKTDNKDLFDFAISELPLAGWKEKAVTYDLHHDPVLNAGNVMTEYEEKFSAKGNPICKYIICRCSGKPHLP